MQVGMRACLCMGLDPEDTCGKVNGTFGSTCVLYIGRFLRCRWCVFRVCLNAKVCPKVSSYAAWSRCVRDVVVVHGVARAGPGDVKPRSLLTGK